MNILIKEVLSAWKWILGCGLLVSFLSTILNQYLFGGIAPNLLLIGIFLFYSITITLICVCVFMFRNITLKGKISFWGAFFVLIFIFLTIAVLYEPINNLIFHGYNDEYAKHYYDNDEEGGIYETDSNNFVKILISLFLVFNAVIIARVLSKKTSQY